MATFDVRPDADRPDAYRIDLSGVPIGTAERPEDVLASLEWAINNMAVEQLGQRHLLFHAGAVSYAGLGMLLPAPSGSGKSTLVAALVAGGFRYLSDEVGVLDPAIGRLLPFPKSLCVKQGGRQALADLYPELAEHSPRRRFGGEPIWYLPPRPGACATGPAPLRHVVIRRYVAGAETTLEPIARSEALLRLMEQSFSLPAHGAGGMQKLVAALGRADCYALTVGDLGAAVELLCGLAGSVRQTGQSSTPVEDRRPPPIDIPESWTHPPEPPRPAVAVPVRPTKDEPPRAAAEHRPQGRTARWLVQGSSALIGLGVLLLVGAAAIDADLLRVTQVTVPHPPALDRPRPADLDLGRPVGRARDSGRSAGLGQADVADAEAPAEGSADSRPAPGRAVRLRLGAIGLETDVVEAGMIRNERGGLEWQTVPFVAAHYVDTALVGGTGNAVITGHVVTMREGNVFRELYRVGYGDRVEVETDGATFIYVVDELELVLPSAVQVMDPTPDERLTLITCGGEFDPIARAFSHRLIVVGKFVD